MNIVILAAGLGKRMRSALPKVLHPLAGKPLLQHVVDEARALDPDTIVVVYGHGGEAVSQAIPGDDLRWVLQQPQLGTGHAVQQAAPLLADGVPTLVLYGDVPLIRAATLDRLLQAGGQDALALLTVELDDPPATGGSCGATGGSYASSSIATPTRCSAGSARSTPESSLHRHRR